VNCDGIARWYRWIEYGMFGRALERTRLEYMHVMANARRALVVGDGDGRFLESFVEHNREVMVDSVDSSREMLRLAAERLRRVPAYSPQRIRLHHADAREFYMTPADYDLIVTHFFLDCFNDEENFQLISRIASAAAPGAKWIVSEFRRPGAGFGRYRAAVTICASYLFFQFATGLRTRALPDYSRALMVNGFRRNECRTRSNGMLVSELWQGS
jgi:ubiquinone/menaquinone biosynthesis C-methylase UbiE